MSRIEFVLKRLSLTSTREELRAVAYALGEWLVARDEPALSATYDRLRALRGAAAADAATRERVDVLTHVLEGYFAAAETVRHLERLFAEVSHDQVWSGIVQHLNTGPANQTQLCSGVGRTKATVSVACEELRRRELIELVPSESRRENVHELTRLGKQVLERMAEGEGARPVVGRQAVDAPPPAQVTSVQARVPDRARTPSAASGSIRRVTQPPAVAAGRAPRATADS